MKTLLILIVIPLSSAACNVAATSPTAAPTNPPPPVMETYTNTTQGYSIQYPAGLELEANEDGSYVWVDRQISISVNPLNPEEARGDGPLIETAEDIFVGSMPARHLTGHIGAIGGNTQQRFESVVIPHNSLYYMLTVFELKNDVVLPEGRTMEDVSPEALVLFERVLASLQFI
jgi:hypothetical protein